MIQVQDSKSNTVWSTSLFLCIILRYFPYCKYTSQYSKSKWSHITKMLRFYINICKWRTYKLIYDHGEDWKLFIAIELVQTIFLGWFQMLAPSNYPLEFHPNKSYYPGTQGLDPYWNYEATAFIFCLIILLRHLYQICCWKPSKEETTDYQPILQNEQEDFRHDELPL